MSNESTNIQIEVSTTAMQRSAGEEPEGASPKKRNASQAGIQPGSPTTNDAVGLGLGLDDEATPGDKATDSSDSGRSNIPKPGRPIFILNRAQWHGTVRHYHCSYPNGCSGDWWRRHIRSAYLYPVVSCISLLWCGRKETILRNSIPYASPSTPAGASEYPTSSCPDIRLLG